MKVRLFLFAFITIIVSSFAEATAPLPEAAPNSTAPAAESPVSVEKTTKPDDQKMTDATKYTQVVDEYKKYLISVKPEIRDEIREYRKEVTKINKTKTGLYKRLSQEAQDFLAKEREFKKKLPMRDKKAFNKEMSSN